MDDGLLIDQEISPVAEAPAQEGADNSRAKRNCLIFLLAVAVIGGFLLGLCPQESDYLFEEPGKSDYEKPIEFAFSLIITFAVLAWCFLDAEERNFNFSRKCSICFVFFPYICFPWYILRTRKGAGCLNVFAMAAVFIVLYTIVCGLGYAGGIMISGIF